MENKKIKVAFAGNPNSGKTTIFNGLTGARQYVGNWPGVTVEKKEGYYADRGYRVSVVDLPGIYSLSAYSADEIVARNYILNETPDVLVNVIDSSNLERNLYLALELIELSSRTKVILVLNMYDYILNRKLKTDIEQLSNLIGVPIVTTIGTTGQGIDELKDKIVTQFEKDGIAEPKILNYGIEIEEEIEKISKKLSQLKDYPEDYPIRWSAIKILEGDTEILKLVNSFPDKVLHETIDQSHKHLKNIFGENSDIMIADKRYGYINGLLRESGHFENLIDRQTVSDKIDLVITSRIGGLPIFFLLMFLIFQTTFRGGAYLQELIERGLELLSTGVVNLAASINMADWLLSFFVDGIIGGAGGVLLFVPNIFILFFLISLLEDSGYMARAAFIMDNIMHKMGLHGKSFIPLILGFGCNVPAIMAARTLEDRKDRLITILIVPLMSCSARLPIYVLLAGAFFPQRAGLVIFLLYLMGIVIAILLSKLFNKLFFKGLSNPFVMELPPYRVPTIKGALLHMWERGSIFLKKIGTVVLISSVVIWFLGNFPLGVDYASQQSYIGMIGTFISPVVQPIGFGWIESTALLFGFVAKEIVVGTFGVLLNSEGLGLVESIQGLMTPLRAFAFMVFTLIYTPCISTIAAIKRETGSYKWTAFSVLYSTGLAWVLAYIIVRIGILFGLD